jgi:SAM-dependent methyltransferase
MIAGKAAPGADSPAPIVARETTVPPSHLAAVLADAGSAREVEPGIWRSAGAEAPLAQYDAIGRAYDFVGGLDLYHRIFWGTSTRDYRTFADAAVTACGSGTMLDAGCGSMLFTAQAHRTNRLGAAIGTDMSLEMLKLARARLGSFLDTRALALLQADMLRTPFRAGAFDVVICLHVVHVLDDLNGLLGEMERILKPGGELFLTSVVLVDGCRDRYLRMLAGRGIMAAPRRADDILATARSHFKTQPTGYVKGSLLFAQLTKP